MMSGYGYNGWGWMWLVGALLVIGIVVLIVFLVRNSVASPNAGAGVTNARSTPRQILDERYARGELTTEEYRERIETLGGKA